MLSRVASSLYWISRYVERAENVARYIDVNQHLTLDHVGKASEQWLPLIVTTGDEADFVKRYPSVTRESVIEFLTFDLENPNSIISCLTMARDNARAVRPAISSEMWEYVNRAYLSLREPSARALALDCTWEFYTGVRELCYLFAAATDGTMAHGEAWHFAQTGRMLERADQTSRILDVKYFLLLPGVEYVGTPLDAIQWAALLKSVSAFAMYRQRYGRITPGKVAHFLMLDDKFPRAIRFCLIHAERSMRSITGSPQGSYQNPAERLLGRLRAELDYTHIDEIFDIGLHEYLDRVQGRMNEIDTALYQSFFQLRAIDPAAPLTPPGQSQSQTTLEMDGR
jgi:uncharacterized alpha-E superfamily protein